MWDALLTELNYPKAELTAEDHDMPKKYHKQLNSVFKKYYHTAIRKLLLCSIIISLVYVIIDNVFNYKPSKIASIIIIASMTMITAVIAIYPLIRIHRIKKRNYKWHIGNTKFARNGYIYVDSTESVPTNKTDYKTQDKNDIYILVWIKKKKYAINTHTSDANDLAA